VQVCSRGRCTRWAAPGSASSSPVSPRRSMPGTRRRWAQDLLAGDTAQWAVFVRLGGFELCWRPWPGAPKRRPGCLWAMAGALHTGGGNGPSVRRRWLWRIRRCLFVRRFGVCLLSRDFGCLAGRQLVPQRIARSVLPWWHAARAARTVLWRPVQPVPRRAQILQCPVQ